MPKKLKRHLTINVGGMRYKIDKKGMVTRLGSDYMEYENDFILIGVTTFYGKGNRIFNIEDVNISLKEMFKNPDCIVNTFPLISFNNKIDMLLGDRTSGNRESSYKVLWVK